MTEQTMRPQPFQELPHMNKQTIAPCPFCRWPATAMMDSHTKVWRVYCNDDGTCGDDAPGCCAEGPEAMTEAEAIAAWNLLTPAEPRLADGEMIEMVARAMRAELERQQVPMSEPSDSDPIKHMVVIYHSPAVSLDHLARAAIAAMQEMGDAPRDG